MKMAQINSAKSFLRKQMMEKIKNIPMKDILTNSDIICEKVITNANYKKSKAVSIYLSMQHEVQTLALLQNIFEQNKECYIPRFEMGGDIMEMVKLNSMEDYYSLPVNKWNIRQPSTKEPRTSVFKSGILDLVIVPGLAFTTDGRRLGHGKGYYDKFLAQCRHLLPHPPLTIGLAFTQQMLQDIPVSTHDFSLDLVIHENSI